MLKLIFIILFSTSLFCQIDIDRMSESDLLCLQKQIEVKLNDVQSYQFGDFAKAFGYSIGSGVSLGVFESNAFGYQYPHLKDGALKEYLTWNTPTDKVFGKLLYPQKVSRETLYLTSRASLNAFKKFYKGNMFFAYCTWWVFHNTFATVYRDWAKHGKANYSFDYSLIF